MESRPDGSARRRPTGQPRSEEVEDSGRTRQRPSERTGEGQRRKARPRPENSGETRTATPRSDGERRAQPGAAPERRRRARPEEATPSPRRRTSGEIHTRPRKSAAEATDGQARPPRPRKAAPDQGQRPAATRRAPAERSSGERPSANQGNTAARKRRRPASATGTRPDTTAAAARSTRAAAPDAPTTDPAAGHAATTGNDAPAPETSAAALLNPPPRGGRRSIGGRLTGGRSVGRILVALLSVAVLLCTGYAWNSISTLESDITRLGGLGLASGGGDGAVDILLVGTDSRTDAKGNPLSSEELRWLRSGDDVATNTDTILLIRVPNDGSSATAISIPRDSYVEVPGIGKSKINAAYGTTREGVRRKAVEAGKSEAVAEEEGTQAGREALVKTVADLTGVQVDHYAEVGLLGFVLLTKAVGGVPVCLKAAVNEPLSGARFKAGVQTLNGPQALSFVRQRHDLPRGDLDRITRQQAFMASLTQKILSAGTLTDPTKLSQLQNAVSRSVIIDDNWNVLTFAEQLKDLSGGKVKFATIPVLNDHGWSDDGQQSVVTVDPQQVKTFTSNLLDPSRNTGRAEYTVDVNNAGTVDGLAKNVSGILTAKGYQAGKLMSTPTNERDSAVYARSTDDDGAKLLAKDLGGLPIKEDSSLGEHQLRAVLTNTYGGAGSVSDVGEQSTGAAVAAKSNSATNNTRPAITAGTDGPTCVN